MALSTAKDRHSKTKTSTARDVGTWLTWITLSKGAGQLISWASTILVMRLLDQHDYGVMAIAMLYITIAAITLDIGLGASLLRNQEDVAREAQAFAVSLIIGVGAFSALGSLGFALGWLYELPELPPVLAALSLAFVIGPIGLIQDVRLSRSFAFKQRAAAEIVSTIGAALTTLLAALTGWGIWALVLGNLVGPIAKIALMTLMVGRPPRPTRPRLSEISEFLEFGRDFAASRLALAIETNIDRFIAAKVLSTSHLGEYAAANYWSQLPLGRMMAIGNTLLFPLAANQYRTGESPRSSTLHSLRLISYVAFPAYWLLAALSDDLVHVLLGERWAATAPMLLVLCLSMPLRVLVDVTDTFLRVHGQGALVVWNHGLGAVLIAALSVIAVHFGPLALASVIAIATALSAFYSLYRSGPALKITRSELVLAPIKGVVVGGCIAGSAVLINGYAASMDPFLRLAASSASALLLFTLLVGFLERSVIRQIISPISRPTKV